MASTLYGITPTQQTVKSITQPVDNSIYGLRSYVFEQLDDSLIANLQAQISNQIRLYIPNAELVSINVRTDDGHYSGIPTLVVYLSVKEKETNEIIPLEFAT